MGQGNRYRYMRRSKTLNSQRDWSSSTRSDSRDGWSGERERPCSIPGSCRNSPSLTGTSTPPGISRINTVRATRATIGARRSGISGRRGHPARSTHCCGDVGQEAGWSAVRPGLRDYTGTTRTPLFSPSHLVVNCRERAVSYGTRRCPRMNPQSQAFAARMQNSLPSGSASTTQLCSP